MKIVPHHLHPVYTLACCDLNALDNLVPLGCSEVTMFVHLPNNMYLAQGTPYPCKAILHFSNLNTIRYFIDILDVLTSFNHFLFNQEDAIQQK